MLLTAILDADAGLTVVGEAADGAEGLELVRRLQPSVVVMDIDMPDMDGFEATKRIMIEQPTPIVIVTASTQAAQIETSLKAVRAGALTVVPKPAGPGSASHRSEAARLVALVKGLADVKVVRQHDRTAAPDRTTVASSETGRAVAVVGVAASTGGPPAVYRFLELLPRTLDVPVLVVQHLAAGFVDGLARWLAGATVLPVCVATDGLPARGGEVYIAAEDRHLELVAGSLRLSTADPVGGFRPSADVLFCSLADGHGAGAAAVILTGMGNDGAAGAARVRQAGGLVLAQDADTCVVYGMPRAVVQAGLADAVGPVDDLAYRIGRSAPKRNW
jgi:two-component system chemotaxis response regulator CheB